MRCDDSARIVDQTQDDDGGERWEGGRGRELMAISSINCRCLGALGQAERIGHHRLTELVLHVPSPSGRGTLRCHCQPVPGAQKFRGISDQQTVDNKP
jgi:hypothetical protein